MSKHLLKYKTKQAFESEQGTGSKFVNTIEPGVAYVSEDKTTAYNDNNEPEPEPVAN